MPKLPIPLLLLTVSLGVVYSQDPCAIARNIYDPSKNRSSEYRAGAGVPLICDYNLSRDEWVFFDRPGTEARGSSMPNVCIASGQCGTETPWWMDGASMTFPTESDPGPHDARICATVSNECCAFEDVMKVKWCSPGYYVYQLPPASFCSAAYCFDEVILVLEYPRFFRDTLTLQKVIVNATIDSIGCSVKFNSDQIDDVRYNGPFKMEINLGLKNGSAVIPVLPEPFIHDSTEAHTYVIGRQHYKDYLGYMVTCTARAYWERTPNKKSPIKYSAFITLV